MASTTPTIAGMLDKEKMKHIIALNEWMRHCNDDPNIHYAAFKDPAKDAWGYTAPDASMGKGLGAPPIAHFLWLAAFIESVNLEDYVPYHIIPSHSEFSSYTHQPDTAKMASLQRQVSTNTAQKALARDMLDTLTRFRERGFDGMQEKLNDASEADKKAYANFASIHAHILNRVGNNRKFSDDLPSGLNTFGFGALRFFLAIPFYPILFLIGGAAQVYFSAYRLFYPGSHPLQDLPTTDWRRYLLGGLSITIGESGDKYWAQAGFTDWRKGEFFSLSLDPIRMTLGALSWAWVTVFESVVKAFFYPLRWVIGYDTLAPDSPIRQTINALESTIIGIFASPAILLNHVFRGVLDVIEKTFASFDKDPQTKWLAEKLDIDLKTTTWMSWDGFFANATLLLFVKAPRLMFDTIPAILTNGIIGVLRSVFPAIPGTTKEQRDKGFNALSWVVYGALFTMTATFLLTLIIVALGATLPGWLGVIFGASEGMTANELGQAYFAQIGNVIQTIWNAGVSFFTNPLQFVGTHFNPAEMFTSSWNALKDAWQGIQAPNLSNAAITGITVGGTFGGVAAGFGITKWYRSYKKEKENAASSTEQLVPEDATVNVQKKVVEMVNRGPAADALGGLTALQRVKDTIANNTGTTNSGGPTNGSTPPPNITASK